MDIESCRATVESGETTKRSPEQIKQMHETFMKMAIESNRVMNATTGDGQWAAIEKASIDGIMAANSGLLMQGKISEEEFERRVDELAEKLLKWGK